MTRGDQPYDTRPQGLYYPEKVPAFREVDRFPSFDFEVKAQYSGINAWWLANAAHLAYHPVEDIRQTLARLGFDHVRTIQEQNTFCLVAGNQHFAFLSFRGTQFKNKTDARTNLNIPLVPVAPGDPEPARVHRGFTQALDLVWEPVLEELQSLQQQQIPCWFTGHSMGSALAILAATRHAPAALYTFGAPRVGNTAFNRLCRDLPIFRVVNCCDIVPHLPPVALGFMHVGETRFINRHQRMCVNPRAWRQLLMEWSGALVYAAGFPLFRRNTVSARALADHSIVNYSNALWNLAADEQPGCQE